MLTKFYVYGGGRWRELDVNTGRVSGWAKSARIVVARSGRLECPRARPVLRALQALAAGERSRARDGPRLPHARWDDEQCQPRQLSLNCPCQHWCQHGNNAVVENECKHVHPVPEAPPPPVPPPPQPQPPQVSTRALQTDDIFDMVRNECVQEQEPSWSRPRSLLPRKPNTIASSSTEDAVRPITRRLKRQRFVSSDSSVEFVQDVGVSEVGQQSTTHNNVQLLESRENKKARRGRPPKRKFGDILGTDTIILPEPSSNTRRPLFITSAKWNATSTPNNTSAAKCNGDVGRSLQQLRPVSLTSSSSTNEDLQDVPKLTDVDITREESGCKSDDDKCSRTTEMCALFASSLYNNRKGEDNDRGRQGMSDSTPEVCKELVIEESDVIALRGFLRRCAPSISLYRFDSDDEYKRGIFYRINPLVSVERNKRIEQMLCEDDDISLREFASQLGLRSVSDEPPRSRKTPADANSKPERKRKEPDWYTVISPLPSKSRKKSLTSSKTKVRKNSVSTLSAITKTNAVSKSSTLTKVTPHKTTSTPTKMTSPKQASVPIPTTLRDPSSAQPKTISNEQLSAPIKTPHNQSLLTKTKNREKASESTKKPYCKQTSAPNTNTQGENSPSKPSAPTKVRAPENIVSVNGAERTPASVALPQISAKSPSARPHRSAKKTQVSYSKVYKEYSSLEDVAIVSWVSEEGRARLVNGNRIWLQLQEQHEQLTGQVRTWQSLRNRYLRYILPGLASLEVPTDQAARLRAAAAAGEIKGKRRPARRNSMFATPGVRGAWSRRPRPRSPTPARTPSPPATPQHTDGKTSTSVIKSLKRKRSSSSSSSSASEFVAGPQLRYSDVTRRFAGRQAARYATDSASSVSSPAPSPVPTSTRTRKLFNPKGLL